MILYKYVPFDTGLTILGTSALGFSHLEDFNDLFEGAGLGLCELEVPFISCDQCISESIFTKILYFEFNSHRFESTDVVTL